MFGIVGLVRSLLGLFWAAICAFVGARFLALLLGANANNDGVAWLYGHSDFWVKPWFHLLNLSNKAVNSTGGVFEPASLIAFLVYFFGGLIVISLITMPFMWMPPRRPTYVP